MSVIIISEDCFGCAAADQSMPGEEFDDGESTSLFTFIYIIIIACGTLLLAHFFHSIILIRAAGFIYRERVCGNSPSKISQSW